MDAFLQAAVAGAGLHLGRVVQMMIDGVAFPTANGKVYDVYSHEGDELGQLTTADVNFATNYMKRLGRPVGKCNSFRETSPGLTFHWVDWLMYNGKRM